MVQSLTFRSLMEDCISSALTSLQQAVLVNTEDYLMAGCARELQIKIGCPSTKQFICIVTSNQLPNCPVTRADIIVAEHIFGPDIGSLKGKMVRHQQSP